MQNFESGCSGNDHIYRTGSTNPPKSYRGIIAALLILVIVLISIVTVLGMMNIHLFRMLEQQADSSVAFAENGVVPAAQATIPPEGVNVPQLGLTAEEIESLYRSYNDWPVGLYISQMEPNGPAAEAGIQLGDILVAVDGVAITGKEDFQEKMVDLKSGCSLQFTVFRDNSELTFPLTPIFP